MATARSSKTRRFRTPRRRLTRQRSGFNVSGEKLGSTCRIEVSQLIRPHSGEIQVQVALPKLTVPRVFQRGLAVIGAGIYIHPGGSCACSGTFSWREGSQTNTSTLTTRYLAPRKWNRVGTLAEPPTKQQRQIVVSDLLLTLRFATHAPISAFAPLIGGLSYGYFTQHDVYDAFHQKTSLYIPEILYLDPCADQWQLHIVQGTLSGQGHTIVCKSCNRCNRYQPIDIDDERNTLAYSNHCVSRAPCTHPAFATYRVVAGDTSRLGSRQIEGGYVVTRYGHQLECVVCKKFFVNLPLNPLRNSTQHREDALRRRALEVLVTELLGKRWVYHEHRLVTGAEFDVHIWRKFGKQCFRCGIDLPTPNLMDLDHTLPLAYLWPLDTTATCLCSSCNSSKSDKFPIEFYEEDRLEELSQKTGIALDTLKSRPINSDAVKKLFERIAWFFDVFLAEPDYQKVREGKKAADLIVHALQNVLTVSGISRGLVETYRQMTGRFPTTVNLTS